MTRFSLAAIAPAAAALVLAVATLGPGCHSSPQTRPGAPGGAAQPAADGGREAERLEVVHAFHGPIGTGVAVSREGRTFVCFPRWGDAVEFTVGELRGGAVVPYPDRDSNTPRTPEDLLSVQSVVVDSANRLWALDTGSVDQGPLRGPQWPKLVGFDLATNQRVQTIHFPPEVVLPTTYLNDVRFDLSRGRAGYAFISDSSPQGPNGIIVVDLATGSSRRRLSGDPSVRADPAFVGVVEGEAFLLRPKNEPPSKPTVGVDGIAVAGEPAMLFYCPLAGRQLHRVAVDALVDPAVSDAALSRAVVTEERSFASDGLVADAQGQIFMTDWEHGAIVVRSPAGRYDTVVRDPRLLWPDSLALSRDGWLYVTANQLHRLPRFHEGRDLRVEPWYLFRVRTVAQRKFDSRDEAF